MSIGARFAWLALRTALLSASALGVTITVANFEHRKALWQAESTAAFSANGSWPPILHYRNAEAAKREFGLLEDLPINFAWILARHVDGEIIASLPGSRIVSPPILPERSPDNRSKVLFTVATKMDSPADNTQGALASMPFMDRFLILSVPITSPIDPLRSDLGINDYRLAQSQKGDPRTQYVVGYLVQGVPLREFIFAVGAQSGSGLITAVALAALLLVFAIALRHARALSLPFMQLSDTAHAINAGQVPAKIQLPQGSENDVAAIAQTLNGVIDGLHHRQSKKEADRLLMTRRRDSSAGKFATVTSAMGATRQRVNRLSYFDPVTGLANRRLMLEHMSLLIQIAARERRHLGLVLLDVSDVRKVYETRGRTNGDTVLRELAARVMETVRESDLISREPLAQDLTHVDRDEFCVVMHGIHEPEGAMAAAKRLLDVVQAPLDITGEPVRIESFAGVAIAPNHACTPEGLVRAADTALSAARKRKNGYPAVFDADMDESERCQLESDLRTANYDQEFHLLYQPQVDANDRSLLGAEALLRWRHPSLGDVPPHKFIPIAEHTGQIEDIGSWVVRRACADLSQLKAEGKAPPRVSVNISSAQLGDAFNRVVRNAIDEYQLLPGELGLELSEAIISASVGSLVGGLQSLHDEAGIYLSVDDFGTGYSSLTDLSQFPLDELKVDRSFVLAMESDPNAQQLVAAIVAIGQRLKLSVTVEGVESIKQLNPVKKLGSVGIQGFYVSPPLTREDLAAFIAGVQPPEG